MRSKKSRMRERMRLCTVRQICMSPLMLLMPRVLKQNFKVGFATVLSLRRRPADSSSASRFPSDTVYLHCCWHWPHVTFCHPGWCLFAFFSPQCFFLKCWSCMLCLALKCSWHPQFLQLSKFGLPDLASIFVGHKNPTKLMLILPFCPGRMAE